MGFVSYAEDNEELRLHRQQLSESINKVRILASKAGIIDPNTIEKQIKRFVKRISNELDIISDQVNAAFKDAQKLLSDPTLRIVKKLEKKDLSDKKARGEVSKLRKELSACRRKQGDLLAEIERLKTENSRLNDSKAWTNEISDARTLKK